jgi:PhnB protein
MARCGDLVERLTVRPSAAAGRNHRHPRTQSNYRDRQEHGRDRDEHRERVASLQQTHAHEGEKEARREHHVGAEKCHEYDHTPGLTGTVPFVVAEWNHCRMTTRLNPYINFRGNAREAIEFYHSVFGGELTIGTFAEFEAVEDPAEADQIMHAQLETPGGLTIMVSDSPARFEFNAGNNVSVSLSGDDESELSGYFTKLSDQATIEQPLTKAPWGDSFGMLTDKFGTRWLVNISAPAA